MWIRTHLLVQHLKDHCLEKQSQWQNQCLSMSEFMISPSLLAVNFIMDHFGSIIFFNSNWQFYNKKISKQEGERAWKKIKSEHRNLWHAGGSF